MTKDGYAVAGYLLVGLASVTTALVFTFFGLSTAVPATIFVGAVAFFIVHTMAMVLFGMPVLHVIGAARGWWRD